MTELVVDPRTTDGQWIINQIKSYVELEPDRITDGGFIVYTVEAGGE